MLTPTPKAPTLISQGGALIFSATQMNGRAPRGIVRLIRQYQAYLFFPMLLLEGINLHVASVRHWPAGHRGTVGPKRRCWPRISPATWPWLCWYWGPGWKAAAFVIVQQGLFGLYLGCSFAPNHKGMPILTAADRSDFLRRQVLTSRNIRGGWLTDLALGGLNYQIEHHLFPSAPRPSLRRCQPLIRAFCEQRGVPYCQTSLVGSFASVLGHLDKVGRPSPRPPMTSDRAAGYGACRHPGFPARGKGVGRGCLHGGRCGSRR